jgi:two-component sensor histidine kinase
MWANAVPVRPRHPAQSKAHVPARVSRLMASLSDRQTAFQREVASRFGLVPNFFSSAPDAPEIVDRLWDFAKAAYLDNPLPSLLKERLFVYLSRFCEVRYCIVRHCAFLMGYGHAAGDPSVAAQTVEQVIRLLKSAPPWQREIVFSEMHALPAIKDWPAPETEAEDWLIAAATLVFVEPGRSERPRDALRQVLGGNRFEHLLGLLTFIRTAHYWTVLHPELLFEEDARELLRLNEELARVLLQDPEAARCDMGARLFAELDELRELNERRELEKTKRALEEQVREKELLLNEMKHRINNNLATVQALATKTLHSANSDERASFVARLHTLARAHELLTHDWHRASVKEIVLRALDPFQGSHEKRLLIEGPDTVYLDPNKALLLTMTLHELATNAVKYGALSNESGRVRVAWELLKNNRLKLCWQESGGPAVKPPERTGFGSLLIGRALHGEAGAHLDFAPEGVTCTLDLAL